MKRKRLTHVGRVLRAYGVGPDKDDKMTPDRLSIRAAALLCDVSKETLARQLRDQPANRNRRLRIENLQKISKGLKIPLDLLEQEMMRDWGYARIASPCSVTGVLSQIVEFDQPELAKLQAEIAQLYQHRLQSA
jgi:hypothetical protein